MVGYVTPADIVAPLWLDRLNAPGLCSVSPLNDAATRGFPIVCRRANPAEIADLSAAWANASYNPQSSFNYPQGGSVSLGAGARLGHYSVTAKLGEGGMGEVWRARDTQLDRDVALKVLPHAFADDPERLARFERKAKVLASLNHPAIAGIGVGC